MVRSEENIRVIVRARPLNDIEKSKGEVSCVTAVNDGREVQVCVYTCECAVYAFRFVRVKQKQQLIDATFASLVTCRNKTFSLLRD